MRLLIAFFSALIIRNGSSQLIQVLDAINQALNTVPIPAPECGNALVSNHAGEFTQGSVMANVKVADFGRTSDTNEHVRIYTITNSLSTQVELIDYGASIRSFGVLGKNERPIDVILGYDKLASYEKNVPYLGCTIGRVGNRIKNGEFTIDGKTYRLPINNGPNHLHGGLRGFSRRMWKTKDVGSDYVSFEYLSKDGEEGYPSTVRATVTYRLSSDSNRLSIDFDAANEGDKTTPISMTNHAYFNLRGVDHAGIDIKDHRLTVHSDHYLPEDDDGLVTGEIRAVNGTPYDLRGGSVLGPRLEALSPKPGGYDVHYVKELTSTTKLLAELSCPVTGLKLLVSSTQPGLQIYTAQYMNETGGKYGHSYGKFSGIAMETQHYPDSVHHPNFPSIWLAPGQKYHHEAAYEIKVE